MRAPQLSSPPSLIRNLRPADRASVPALLRNKVGLPELRDFSLIDAKPRSAPPVAVVFSGAQPIIAEPLKVRIQDKEITELRHGREQRVSRIVQDDADPPVRKDPVGKIERRPQRPGQEMLPFQLDKILGL